MSFVSVPRLPNGDRPIPIVRCPQGGKLQVMPLTNLYGACWTHWNGRTVWCEGEGRCQCGGDQPELCARRWSGWLPVRLYSHARRAILALTPLTALELGKARKAGVNLRGRILTLKRLDARENAPMAVEISEQEYPQGRLPEPFDVTQHVLHALGEPMSRLEELYERGYTMMAREEADLDRDLL